MYMYLVAYFWVHGSLKWVEIQYFKGYGSFKWVGVQYFKIQGFSKWLVFQYLHLPSHSDRLGVQKSYYFHIFSYLFHIFSHFGAWIQFQPPQYKRCSNTNITPKAASNLSSIITLETTWFASLILRSLWFPNGRPADLRLVPRLIGTQLEQGGANNAALGPWRSSKHAHKWVKNPRADKISAFGRNCSTQPCANMRNIRTHVMCWELKTLLPVIENPRFLPAHGNHTIIAKAQNIMQLDHFWN